VSAVSHEHAELSNSVAHLEVGFHPANEHAVDLGQNQSPGPKKALDFVTLCLHHVLTFATTASGREAA
jgi:hypothetical protein